MPGPDPDLTMTFGILAQSQYFSKLNPIVSYFLHVQILHKRILQQAGFIQFGQLQFLEAKEHFR